MKNRTIISKATTGLAGAVAIASGSQAYGAVVSATLPANILPTSGAFTTSVPWDVNGDGTQDFEFDFNQVSTNGNFVSGVYGLGGVGVNATVGYAGAYVTYTNRLSAGATISASSSFAQEAPYVSVLGSRYGTKFYGQFINATGGAAIRGFVGFEFTAADGIHFGDIELSTSRYRSATNPGGITFYSASYQTTPGVPITIVPEPTSLAALAFGAAGAAGVALRRRKAASQPTA